MQKQELPQHYSLDFAPKNNQKIKKKKKRKEWCDYEISSSNQLKTTSDLRKNKRIYFAARILSVTDLKM